MMVTTALLLWQWNRSEFSVGLFIAACLMAVAVAVIAHNHNHVNIWKSKTLNRLTDYWITMFYGFPAFAWIPTHNQNHHKLNNREGDYTVTYRYTEANNLLTLVSYPSISSYHQQAAIYGYLRLLWRTNRKRFWFSVSQYAVLIAFIGGALLIDWKKALLYIVIPHQVGLFSVLAFNYLQHVHADEESKYNHSRNVTGFFLNTFLFNNGYHTVHHETAGMHWSETPAAHAKIAHLIDPRLNEKNTFWFLTRMYLLSPFIPKFRSQSLRLLRLNRKDSVTEMEGTAVLHFATAGGGEEETAGLPGRQAVAK
jgi:fatty acid desaturase